MRGCAPASESRALTSYDQRRLEQEHAVPVRDFTGDTGIDRKQQAPQGSVDRSREKRFVHRAQQEEKFALGQVVGRRKPFCQTSQELVRLMAQANDSHQRMQPQFLNA